VADVFGIALATGGDLLRDAAIDAAHELGLFAAPTPRATMSRRMRALVDYLVASGLLAWSDTPAGHSRVVPVRVPPRPSVPRSGWGLMAEVIRRDKPLSVEGGEIELRYHAHLATVGAAAAAELVRRCMKTGSEPFPAQVVQRTGQDPPRRSMSILDLGAGVGTYAAAFLDANVDATNDLAGIDVRATVVDYAEVIALARRAMARFGERVRFVAHDVRGARLVDEPSDEPGNRHSSGYSDSGSGHDIALLANVLHLHPPETCAELVAITARAVKPGGMVVIKDLRVDDGRAGPFEGLAFALNMAVYTGGGDVYETSQLRAWLVEAGLVGIEEVRLESQPDGIVMIGYRARTARQVFEAIAGPAHVEVATEIAARMPSAFRTMLARAPEFLDHYTRIMPALREEHASTRLFHVPLDWQRLPRLSTIVERLERLARVRIERAPTIAAMYERTHYGGLMPLLYGYPAHVAYFERRGRELGLDELGTIDRYLAAPMLHELCHFDRERDALLPPHLDECIAGFIGVHVWPEMAYPEPGHDDALYAAPWLSQVGQAFARAFGVREIVDAHVGHVPWEAVMPRRLFEEVTRFAWEDWQRRRTSHFLSDTLAPEPWVGLVREAIAARPDDEMDRQIVRDALRAMCLTSTQVDGSLRARMEVPSEPIVIERGWMACGALRYWVPEHVRDQRIVVRSLEEIESVALQLDGRIA
jgi:SAM-dependent methyltransferase